MQNDPVLSTPRLRIGQLTTVDISLAILLRTELEEDVASGADVFAISGSDDFHADLVALGVEPIRIEGLTRRVSLRSDLKAAVDLYRTLRSLHLDVLHTHTPKAGVLGRIIGRLAHIPVVVNTCHGIKSTPEDPLWKKAAVYGAEGFATLFSHFELYQNEADRSALRWFVRGGRSQLVGNGVDLARASKFDPTARQRVRRELGIEPERVLIGGIGRKVEEKGIREFAGAARVVGQAEFVWIGPDDPDKADAITADIDGVRFIDFQHDMVPWYSVLDVFVIPSYREGFSRSGMEAAACGRAIVASDIRGCRELGATGRELVLVPPRSVPAACQRIERADR